MCRACRKEYSAEHYEANKPYYIEKARKAEQRRKDKYNALKDLPCVDCGVSYPPWVMDFDHLGDDKEFTISMSKKGFEAILEEVSKCDVVCSNCHRERTHQRLIKP